MMKFLKQQRWCGTAGC
ncbi:hypothetical protein Godav_000643 [Gossypium davidsonii]|uniref:Uncharacterized protein n=2 Tax=Gossypium TaxID=3633 RepID=A0A7J9CTJ9_GOSGO|nr:hypothetical protein [Gossypium davidsonii]MBA0751634.1 hypothetical protein [Gossypium gossypioides]